MISDMTLERARKIFADVAEMRLRWGKQYLGEDQGVHNLLDAIVVIAHAGNEEDAALRAEITRLNRVIGAQKSRDIKAGKRNLTQEYGPESDWPQGER